MLGPAAGRHLFAVVHGMTSERVETGRRRGSIGAQRALGRGPHRDGFVRAALLGLVDRVCRRMRGAHRIARTVVLRLRFDDYTRATRSHTFPHATDSGDDLAAAALLLLDGVAGLVRERGLTLVGVALTNLAPDDVVQPALPLDLRGAAGAGSDAPRVVDGSRRETHGLDLAVDQVAERFGSGSVRRASLLRHGEGFAAPLLPEADDDA
jgi:DNA polymerase-4